MLRGLFYFTLFLLIVSGALAASWYMGWIDDEVDAAVGMVRSAGVSAEVSASIGDGDLRFVQIEGLTHPGTIEQVAGLYGTRLAAATKSLPAAYNTELLDRLLEMEQTRIAEVEGRLAVDPDRLQSFNDDWSILVVSPSVKLDLQLLALEQTHGAQWWRGAARGWKLVLLHDRAQALEQELNIRETGIAPQRRHALMQQTAMMIDQAVAALEASSLEAFAAETN